MGNGSQEKNQSISGVSDNTPSNQQNSAQSDQRISSQEVPLSKGQQEAKQKLDNQVQTFEQKLEGMSNRQLKQISRQLEGAERAALLEKIDNQLNTLEETIVKPGEASSPAAAATTAVVAQNASSTTTP